MAALAPSPEHMSRLRFAKEEGRSRLSAPTYAHVRVDTYTQAAAAAVMGKGKVVFIWIDCCQVVKRPTSYESYF